MLCLPKRTRLIGALRFCRSLWGIFFVALLLFSATVYAAERHWVGQRNTLDDRWEDTENWSTITAGDSGATIPGAADIAIFSVSGSTVTLRSEVRIDGLYLKDTWTGSFLQGSGTLVVLTSGIRVGSGTFVGSSGALIANAAGYTQTGGIVSVTAGTYTQSGSFSLTNGGGTGIPNPSFTSTGTVVLDGNADQTFTKGANTTLTLSGLTLENSGGGTSDDIIVDVNGGLNLSGALTITSGNLDLDTNNTALAVERGVTLASDTQATLISDANVTASGTVSVGAAGSIAITGTATFTLNGDDQNVNVNNASIPNLTIASSSGTTLTGHARVSSVLRVNTGSTLTLDSFTLGATGATIINHGNIDENTGKLVHTPASFFVADSSYAEVGGVSLGSTAYFQLDDADENTRGTSAETVSITATTTQGESETITLTERDNFSGIFRGSIATADKTGLSVTPNNGTLEAGGSDTTVTITFTDAEDGIATTDTAGLTVPTSGGGGGGGGAVSSGGGGGRATKAVKSGDIRPVGTRQYKDMRGQEVREEKKAPEKPQPLLQERVCGRVVRRFAEKIKLLQKINARLQKRFGFSCQ